MVTFAFRRTRRPRSAGLQTDIARSARSLLSWRIPCANAFPAGAPSARTVPIFCVSC